MGNLGDYQRITTLFKQLGGPRAAKFYLAGGAAALFAAGGAAYAGIQRIGPLVKNWLEARNQLDSLAGSSFIVHTATEDDQGLRFEVDDQFRVLERDKDAVLIELIGNDDNPWVVSSEVLSRISDFPSDSAAVATDR